MYLLIPGVRGRPLLWEKGCLPKGCCKRVRRQRGCLSGGRENEGPGA